MPVAEFTKGNKRVLFVGMTHTGPKGYYLRTRQVIDKWLRQEDTPATILTEFFTCQTSTLDTVNGSKIKLAQLQKLVQQQDSSNVSVMGNSVISHKCTLDLDGRTLRPAFLVDRNREGCEEVHQKGFECQWGDLWYPSGENISVQSGDLRMDREPRVTQVIASMAYRDWDWADPRNPDQTKFWNSTFESLIIDKRNSHLAEEMERAFRSSDRVVLPWGSAHLDGIKELLESNGFKQSTVGGVLYAEPNDFGKWDEFDKIIGERIHDADPMAGNCSPSTTSAHAPSSQVMGSTQ